MVEKSQYSKLYLCSAEKVLRDIAVEIQYEPETWCDDAEGKKLWYEAYARRLLKWFEKVA